VTRRPVRKTTWRPIGVAVVAMLLASTGAGYAAPPTEYQVKAVFLYNFAQFVQWPAAAFSTPDEPFGICVYGEDPFGAHLDDTVRGESAHGHPMVVRRTGRVEDMQGCHILFLGDTGEDALRTVLPAIEGQPILTVADADETSRRGVMIRFVPANKRIRLRIDLDATRTSQLTLSSNLLRPAEIVGSRTD
jgi:hypothetical protein